jgi:CheY-like chemotaxis protein
VIVTDLVLPGPSGVDLCRRARALDPAVEVVVVTQQDEVRSAVEAMQAGASDYLVKPIERSELLFAVRRAVERGQLRREKDRLLGENLVFARNQAIYQKCLSLLATLDSERLYELSMQALSRATDAQSGALWTADDRGELVLRGFTGLTDREALASRIDPASPEVEPHLASGAPFAAASRPLAEAFQVPLIAAGDVQGLALLSDPLAGSFSDEAVRVARTVADFAAMALRNARRFSQVERVGLRDRETAAYNLSFFVDYASSPSSPSPSTTSTRSAAASPARTWGA